MKLSVQDAWNKIQNSRVSCGKNTVFVEYNFDAAYEYYSDLTNFNRIVTCMVYVVTKVGVFKFLTFCFCRFIYLML